MSDLMEIEPRNTSVMTAEVFGKCTRVDDRSAGSSSSVDRGHCISGTRRTGNFRSDSSGNRRALDSRLSLSYTVDVRCLTAIRNSGRVIGSSGAHVGSVTRRPLGRTGINVRARAGTGGCGWSGDSRR